MTAIDWINIDPTTYERMVGVLLCNLYPEAKRIDGTGGDGGIDVAFERSDGLHIFELKSFATRLNTSRRTQIKRSLRTAAGQSPVDWTLVLPLDLTPDEVKWFDQLKRETPFPIDWWGRTWLDGQFASHPYVRAYFLDGADTAVVNTLRELHGEEAALANGVPDAIARAERLVRRANELDPYYVFGIESGPGGSTVKIQPRYNGADEDRPITVKLGLRFDNTDEGRQAQAAFEEAIAFWCARRTARRHSGIRRD